MVDAVAYCGRLGVVHCDIKPENVLIDGGWHFKLADFGLSSVVAQRGDYATSAGACGTPEYMAPEVFTAYERGERVRFSAWTDAYSLGLTLLQTLRLLPRPILVGKEDARRFHEMRRNVEVTESDHPLSYVTQALRSMLRHDKDARATAAGVLQTLSEQGVFEGSTAQTVASLFDEVRANIRVRAPAPSQAAARGNVADRQLRHPDARAFWGERHGANAPQWEWTNFSDCLFAKWRALSSRSNELKTLLVPEGRNDVPMAWLDAAVAEYASLSLGDALAMKLGISPSVPAENRTEQAFDGAIRALHFAPFQFNRARMLFKDVLADESATAMEKARAHLSLIVLNNEQWGGFRDYEAMCRHKAVANASATLLLRVGDECDPVRAFEMGYCHTLGVGTAIDKGKAHSLFVSSANGGCATGMLFLGKCLLDASSESCDRPAGIAQYERVAAMGHFGAMYLFGSCLYYGIASRNEKRSVELIHAAAVDEGDWSAKEWVEFNKSLVKVYIK